MAAACQTRLLADRQVLQEDDEIPVIACIESTASTDEISFVTCLILTASSCMCTGKFKSMGIENTLSAFMMISAAVVLAAIVFLMELMLRGTLLKPAKASRKYEMEDSVSERGEKFKRETRRRSSI